MMLREKTVRASGKSELADYELFVLELVEGGPAHSSGKLQVQCPSNKVLTGLYCLL